MRNPLRKIRSWSKRVAQHLTQTSHDPLQQWLSSAGEIDVVDIGSNRGQFLSGLLSRHKKVKRAWLVEPQQALAKELATKFLPPRFTVHRLALSNQTGQSRLEISSAADVTASLLPIRAGATQLSHLTLGNQITEECPVDTLDRFAEVAGIEQISLLKIDTQGNELQVFQGGTSVLSRTRAAWVELSLVQLYDGACLIHEVVDCLHGHGLYLRDVSPEFRGPVGELLQLNGLFTRISESN